MRSFGLTSARGTLVVVVAALCLAVAGPAAGLTRVDHAATRAPAGAEADTSLSVSFRQPIVQWTPWDFRFTGTAPPPLDNVGDSYAVDAFFLAPGTACQARKTAYGDNTHHANLITMWQLVGGDFDWTYHHVPKPRASLHAGRYTMCSYLFGYQGATAQWIQTPVTVRKAHASVDLRHTRLTMHRTGHHRWTGHTRVTARVREEAPGRWLFLRMAAPHHRHCHVLGGGATVVQLRPGRHTYERRLEISTSRRVHGRGLLCAAVTAHRHDFVELRKTVNLRFH